ncbi:hypothetical protein [Amycolatopsis sp. NPDC051061]|uniref:hypothetical protein n=1 Tax=Amycolatopsis sp. NPDC051061 TaxID=3155042 RepID=UPI003447CCDF
MTGSAIVVTTVADRETQLVHRIRRPRMFGPRPSAAASALHDGSVAAALGHADIAEPVSPGFGLTGHDEAPPSRFRQRRGIRTRSRLPGQDATWPLGSAGETARDPGATPAGASRTERAVPPSPALLAKRFRPAAPSVSAARGRRASLASPSVSPAPGPRTR